MSYTRTEHTPGPWGWFGNANSNSLYLATKHSGRRYVMGFKRWGFSGGQPEFQPAGRGMVDASELLQFEVGDRDVVGVKAARENTSVYRMDVRGIDCADARLIAASPCLLAALESLLNDLSADDEEGLFEHSETVIRARTAIAKARGAAWYSWILLRMPAVAPTNVGKRTRPPWPSIGSAWRFTQVISHGF